MIILTLRTDKPESELGLYDDEKQLAYEAWHAHRELAETIHKKLAEILKDASKELSDIEGVVCFKGPGSFTGLRIGLSVGNALAYAQSIPIVARSNEQLPGSTHLDAEDDFFPRSGERRTGGTLSEHRREKSFSAPRAPAQAEFGLAGTGVVRESWWLEQGIKDLLASQNDKIAIPAYGAEAKTTKQRK
jgi:hypothetical protein